MLLYTLLYLPGILLPRLAAFAVLIAATHILDESQVGILSLIILSGEVSEGVLLNWLRIVFVRVLGSRQASRNNILQALTAATPGIAGALVLCAVAAPFLAGSSALVFFGAAAAYVIANSMLKFSLTFLQVAGFRKLYSALESVRAFAVVGVAVWAMTSSHDPYVTSVSMSAVTAIGAGLAMAFSWNSRQREDISIRISDLFAMAGPLISLAALNFLVTSLDRFLLGSFYTPAVVGIYAASYAIARQGFDVLSNAANTGGFPELVSAYDSGNKALAIATLRRQAALVISLLLTAYVGLVLLRGDLAQVALPEKYREASNYLIPVVAAGAVALNLKNTITDNVLLLVHRNWLQLLGLATGAVVTVVLALVLVPTYVGLGAAIAFAAGCVTCLGVSWWQSRRFLRLGLSWTMLLACGAPPAVVAACWGLLRLTPLAQSPLFMIVGCGVVGGGLALLILATCLRLQKRQERAGGVSNG